MINFDCAELLSYERQFNFWGDAFCPNCIESYTISSRISGDPNLTGAYIVWSGMSGFIASLAEYQGITVNGVSLGTGRLVNINFEEGTDVQYKKYKSSFEILNTGNLYNLTGSYYSDILGVTGLQSELRYVRSFQETVNVNLASNSIQETTQSLSFEIDGAYSNITGLRNSLYSVFASGKTPNLYFFTNTPSVITGSTTSGYINYFQETADQIGHKYSVSKASYYDNNNKATWEYSHNFSYNGNEVNVSEEGSIKSIYFAAKDGSNDYYNLSGARDRWAIISTGIYDRISVTFNSLSGYLGMFTGTGCPLINFPISKSISENQMAGTMDYSYTYSNNPVYSITGVAFTNSRSVSYDEDGYTVITENGEYQGLSENRTGRFTLASGAYFSGSGNIPNRVSGTLLNLTGFTTYGCVYSGNVTKISQQETFEEYAGKIGYSYVYTNSPLYYPTSSNFIKITQKATTNLPVHLINKFLIPWVGEIVQSASQSTEGSFSNEFEIYGKSGTTINDYLTEVFGRTYKPSGSNIFLKDFNYSFSPQDNVFSAKIDYSYTNYRTKNNIFV